MSIGFIDVLETVAIILGTAVVIGVVMSATFGEIVGPIFKKKRKK